MPPKVSPSRHEQPRCRWCGLAVLTAHGSDTACIVALQLAVTVHVSALGSSDPRVAAPLSPSVSVRPDLAMIK